MDRKRISHQGVYGYGRIYLARYSHVWKSNSDLTLSRKKWRAMAEDLYFTLTPVEAERGNILADDGSPLAISCRSLKSGWIQKQRVWMKNIQSKCGSIV